MNRELWFFGKEAYNTGKQNYTKQNYTRDVLTAAKGEG